MTKYNVTKYDVTAARKIISKMFGRVFSDIEEIRGKELFDIKKGVVDTRVVYNYYKKINNKTKHVAKYVPFKGVIEKY